MIINVLVMVMVITETMEPGEREEESMEGSDSQILKPLKRGTVSSTWRISETNADSEMREGNFREASSRKETCSCACCCCVLEGVVVAFDDNGEFCSCAFDCFFFCFEFELEGIISPWAVLREKLNPFCKTPFSREGFTLVETLRNPTMEHLNFQHLTLFENFNYFKLLKHKNTN